jgi:succinoglycan biosynthesis transport protein ExoP
MGTGRNRHPEPLDRGEKSHFEPAILAPDPSAAESASVPARQPESVSTISSRWRDATAAPTLARRGLLQTWRHAWLVALCLGLGLGAVVARGVWQFLPGPPPLYRASTLLRVDWSHPHFRDLVGDRSKADSGQRVHALGDLIRARPILQAALQNPSAANLRSVRPNPEAAFRRIEQSLRVDSNNSQVLRLALTGQSREDLPLIVNAIRGAFLKSYVEDDKKARRGRLAGLDRSYQEIQKELAKVRKELLAAGRPMETDSLDGGREEEFQKQKARAEIELVAARLRFANLQANPPQEKAARLDEDELDARIDKLANKDRQILELQAQGDKLLRSIRELERIAAQPAKLPEYTDAVAEHQAILVAINRRKRSLRPELEKRIHDEAGEQASAENPLDNAIREVQLRESQVTELSKRLQEQVAVKNVLQESRRNLASRRAETSEQKTQDAERLERAAQVAFAKAEILRKELNGPVAAVAVDAADHVELLPTDESRGMKLAGLAGLGVFCLVVAGVSYREHVQRRIYHPDDIVHELSLPVLATTPALAERLDLFDAVLEESQTSSPFAQLCRAIDGICPFVMHEAQDGQARIILVTSALGNEGESEVAGMLAYRLARAGKRTLLMDADIASPRLQDVLGEPGEPGLCDVLRQQAAWTDVIRPAQVNNLWYVRTGRADNHAAEAMGRDDMGRLFDQLRPEFDVIVIDASEILTLAHGLQISRYADAAILTMRRAVSRMTAIFAAHQKLHMLNIPVLGGVYVAGSIRNLFVGPGSMRKGLASICGGMIHAGGAAWKRFANLQSPVAAYQLPMHEEKARKAA